MTYTSKRTLASMVSGIILCIVYGFYAAGQYAKGVESWKEWAITILAFIWISIAIIIVIQILFHIAFAISTAVKNQNCDDQEVEKAVSSAMVEDEMDKLIELKSSRIGYTCAGVGFHAMLIALAFNAAPVIALHVLFGSFFIGALIEGAVTVYLYERGVHNG